jgi:5-oxoprolinase (ATP-hydrolysing)
VVEPGWQATLTAAGPLDCCARVQPRATQHAIGTEADPVMLEVFNNLFMNIAEQMGLRLQNTAYSVNIKERLDFSCALFNAQGELIANAPHMPVHLGSMSESIKTVIARNPAMQPGDVYVLNDPYHGGTHLPDVTVVTPVYLDRGTPTAEAQLLRRQPRPPRRHRRQHAGLDAAVQQDHRRGRRAVRQLPAGARRALREAELRRSCASGRYPARNPDQTIADLRAQIAANEKGVQELQRDGGAVRPRHRGGLHAACAGQRRGVGAPRHHGAEGRWPSSCRWTTAPSSACR